MGDLRTVEITECAQDLLGHQPRNMFLHGSVLVEVALQIALPHELHDDIKIITLVMVFDEFDNVRVPQILHDLHLIVDLLV